MNINVVIHSSWSHFVPGAVFRRGHTAHCPAQPILENSVAMDPTNNQWCRIQANHIDIDIDFWRSPLEFAIPPGSHPLVKVPPTRVRWMLMVSNPGSQRVIFSFILPRQENQILLNPVKAWHKIWRFGPFVWNRFNYSRNNVTSWKT